MLQITVANVSKNIPKLYYCTKIKTLKTIINDYNTLLLRNCISFLMTFSTNKK